MKPKPPAPKPKPNPRPPRDDGGTGYDPALDHGDDSGTDNARWYWRVAWFDWDFYRETGLIRAVSVRSRLEDRHDSRN
jgi:hypothetical protein